MGMVVMSNEVFDVFRKWYTPLEGWYGIQGYTNPRK